MTILQQTYIIVHVFVEELAVAVAADCQDQLFYWSDVSGGKISRASLEGYDKEVVTRGK